VGIAAQFTLGMDDLLRVLVSVISAAGDFEFLPYRFPLPIRAVESVGATVRTEVQYLSEAVGPYDGFQSSSVPDLLGR